MTVEELDLDAEQQVARGGRGGNNNDPAEPEEQGAAGFGLTLQNLTPQHDAPAADAVGPDRRARSPRSIPAAIRPAACGWAT